MKDEILQIAYSLEKGKKSDVLNDDELDFNNFVITKWTYFE